MPVVLYGILIAMLLFQNVLAGDSPVMDGIEQYRQENYEEAIKLLTRAREEDPESTVAAFMLGMAYKQTLQFEKALPHLNDAVRLVPRIREAVVELAYIHFQLKQNDEAWKWLRLAEAENILPARTAFLKGLILQNENRNAEAVAAFETAGKLDTSLAQSCDYNIALCLVKTRNLEKAGEKLQAVIRYNPDNDLSAFARRYQDMLSRQTDMARPLHFTMGVFGQYDSNVVLKPTDSDAASNISGKESAALTTNIRMDYTPSFDGPWQFNAQYSYSGQFHNKQSTTHDTMTNSFYLAPGYSSGKSAVSFTGRYTHSMLRDPGYAHYLSEFRTGPLFRTLLGESHILEFYTGYISREYANPALTEDEERDSDSFNSYLSWIWIINRGAFLNLRYEFTDERTDGRNWDNRGHRFSASSSIPLLDNLKLQVSGDIFRQDFSHTHSSFSKEREDNIYQVSTGLTWEFLRNAQMVAQYNYTRADSNISIYDYNRNLYTFGIEYRY